MGMTQTTPTGFLIYAAAIVILLLILSGIAEYAEWKADQRDRWLERETQRQQR